MGRGVTTTTLDRKTPGNSKGSQRIEEKSNDPVKPRFTRKLPVGDGNGTSNRNNNEDNVMTEAQLCQQLLVDGYVQSYVDFYHLTHRADPNSNDGRMVSKIQTSGTDMVFIRDNLVQARRSGNTGGVYTAYNQLADMYMRCMDWKTSIFFHEKCLEVSQLTADMRAEMLANHALGKCILYILYV